MWEEERVSQLLLLDWSTYHPVLTQCEADSYNCRFQESSEKYTVSVKVRHVGKAKTFLLLYWNNQERQALIYNTSSFNHVSLFYNWSIAYPFFLSIYIVAVIFL